MEIHESKEKIRVRAHQLWEEAGRPHGYDLDHWLQAEKEQLLNSVAAAPLAEEARQEFSGAEPQRKPAKKAKTENTASKTPKKSPGRGKSK
jgi:hypothetical protein